MKVKLISAVIGAAGVFACLTFSYAVQAEETVYKLILLRHGESQWNLEKRFTGWSDIDLTDKGRAGALKAGELLKKEGVAIDEVHTSKLKRAIETASLRRRECLRNGFRLANIGA